MMLTSGINVFGQGEGWVAKHHHNGSKLDIFKRFFGMKNVLCGFQDHLHEFLFLFFWCNVLQVHTLKDFVCWVVSFRKIFAFLNWILNKCFHLMRAERSICNVFKDLEQLKRLIEVVVSTLNEVISVHLVDLDWEVDDEEDGVDDVVSAVVDFKL